MLSEKTRASAIEELANKIRQLEIANADLAKQVQLREKQLEVVATQGLDIRKIHGVDEIESYLNFQPGYLQNLLEANEAEYLKSIFTKYNSLIDIKVQSMKDKQIDVNGDAVATKLKEAVEFFRLHPSVETFDASSTTEYAQTVTKLSNALELLWNWKNASADLANFNEAVSHGIMQYAIKKIALENKITIEKTQALAIDPEKQLEERKTEATAAEEKKVEEIKDKERLAKLEADIATLTSMIAKQREVDASPAPSIEEQLQSVDDAPMEPPVAKKKR